MAAQAKGIKLINSILIQRPLLEVFDYCFNLENELKWNPDGLLSLEALTPGPIVVGTKYLAGWKGSPPMTCEYTYINRPVDWEVYANGKGMDVMVRGEVKEQGSGTLLTVIMTLIPRGFLRLLSPILKRSFQRGEEKNLANIKAHIESTATGDKSPLIAGAVRGN
ncbi:MAG: SRPBCC family protein [Candidatus Promineifilaceae bacterium]